MSSFDKDVLDFTLHVLRVWDGVELRVSPSKRMIARSDVIYSLDLPI